MKGHQDNNFGIYNFEKNLNLLRKFDFENFKLAIFNVTAFSAASQFRSRTGVKKFFGLWTLSGHIKLFWQMKFWPRRGNFRIPCFCIHYSTCFFMFEHVLIKCFLVSSKVEIKTKILTLVTSKSVHPNPNNSKNLLLLNFRNSTHKKKYALA